MKKNICVACEKGTLVLKTVPHEVYGVTLGNFQALACDNCGEVWYDEDTVKIMERLEKQKGFF